MTREADPPRTVVTDAGSAWLATFAEATAANPVASATWVRLLAAWLDAALADTGPDLLAIGMQYVAGAPSVYNATGLRVAGNASYGPLQADGTRKEGSDFNDYLGVAWAYGCAGRLLNPPRISGKLSARVPGSD